MIGQMKKVEKRNPPPNEESLNSNHLSNIPYQCQFVHYQYFICEL